MKRALILTTLFCALMVPAFAQDAPPALPDNAQQEGPRYTLFTKFFRGIGNIIASPFEIPVTAYAVATETDVFIGASAGSVAGAMAGVERLGCGVMDVITFLFPPYDRPIIIHAVGQSPIGKAAANTFPREL